MGDLRATAPSESGQTLPLFAVTIVAAVGFAGLALDGARLFAEHERLQSASDAAAIGVAHELRRGNLRYAEDLYPAAVHDAELQGVTLGDAEIIVHHPPVSGAFVGSLSHAEVVLRVDMPTTFMGMFGRSSQPVSARSVAGLIAAEQPCVVALADGGSAALTVEGEQPLAIDCKVAVASSDPAAWQSGEICVAAAGGVATDGGLAGSCVQGERLPAAENLGDLVSGLRIPDCAGRSPGVADTADDGTVLYWPGCYGQPVEIGSGQAELMPGEHIFLQGLRITGGAVSGRDVSLLFPASAEQSGVAIEEGARVDLAAPSRGKLAEVLMFAEAGGGELNRGPGSSYHGGLYFPGQTLRWAPNAPGDDAWVRVAADRIAILEAAGGRAIAAPPSGTASAAIAALVE